MSEHKFELERQWRRLRGLAYGLQQPALLGRALVGSLTIDDLHRLDAHANRVPGIRLMPHDERADLVHRFAFRLLDWIGALQRLAKVPVSERVHVQVLGRSVAHPGHVVMQLGLPTPNEKAARLALRWVVSQLPRIVPHGQAAESGGESKPPEWVLSRLQPHAEEGLNRFHILQAAQRLDIPSFSLTPRVTAFGTGNCQRLMTSTVTERTTSIGVGIATSKAQTARMLNLAGLPGAQHVLANSEEDAVAAAERLGFPVVVKPDDQERGVGVQANLIRPEQVRQAFSAARAVSERVLVERWVDGSTHRLTVFNGRVIRAVQRLAGGVTGDGVNSIAALVERQAEEVRSGDLPGLQGARAVTLDDEALDLLQQAELDASQVPAPGVRVRLRRRDNINAGGRNVELPIAAVHADNLNLAVAAAAQLRLDIAGIDLISVDIARSWLENGARICEVNAMPQLGVGGDARIYEKLMPELMGGRYRIPVEVVLCQSDGVARSQALQDGIRAHPEWFISDMSGLWHQGRRVAPAFGSGFDAALALMVRPEVTQAMCVLSVEELIEHGFPVNRVDGLRLAWRDPITGAEPSQGATVRQMLRVAAAEPLSDGPTARLSSSPP